MTIEAIKDAILALPHEDRLRLEDWLADKEIREARFCSEALATVRNDDQANPEKS